MWGHGTGRDLAAWWEKWWSWVGKHVEFEDLELCADTHADTHKPYISTAPYGLWFGLWNFFAGFHSIPSIQIVQFPGLYRSFPDSPCLKSLVVSVFVLCGISYQLLCHKKTRNFHQKTGEMIQAVFPPNMTILKNWPQNGQLQSVFFSIFWLLILSHGSFYGFSKHQNPRKKSHQGPDPQTRQGANPPMLWPNVRSFHCWQCKIQSHPRWLRPALFFVGRSQTKTHPGFLKWYHLR